MQLVGGPVAVPPSLAVSQDWTGLVWCRESPEELKLTLIILSESSHISHHSSETLTDRQSNIISSIHIIFSGYGIPNYLLSAKNWKTSVSIYLILFQWTGHDLICYKCLNENVSNDLVTLWSDICLNRCYYYCL